MGTALTVESATVAVLAVFIFLSFYFALLSFYVIDQVQKEQVVLLAVSSIVSGLILFGCLIVYYLVKKSFPQFDSALVDVEKRDDVSDAEG